MSNNDLKFTLRFNAETKSFVGEVKAADVAVDGLGNQATTTGRQLTSMNRHSSSLSTGLTSLRNQLLGVAGGFSALYAAQQATDTLAQYQDIRTRIQALVESEEAWIETEEYLISVSKDHNKSMLDMSDSLTRLLVLEKSGLITHQQTTALFEGMSNAASRNGASSADLGRVMYGLQQAMASGTVRAEEFNQVMEPMPDLIIAMERAAGVASGGLRRMVNDGEVTSQFFAQTLVKALESYEGAAADTADNINAKQNQVTTSYTEMVAAFEAPISDSYVTILDGLAGSMDVIADNADLVSEAVGVTMAVAMGRGAAAVGTLTAKKLADIIADRQKLTSTIADQQATVNATAAEVRRLEVMQVSNNQKFRAIGAETALTAAKAKLKVQTDLLTASQVRANVAGRALGVTMGLLGGPLGIAMMAGSALLYFATQAGDSKKSTNELQGEVSGLVKEFQSLNKQGKQVMLNQLGKEASVARTELVKTQARLRDLRTEATYLPSDQRAMAQSEIVMLEREVSTLEQQVDSANKKFQALFKSRTNGKWESMPEDDEEGGSKPVDKNATKEADRLLTSLQRQVALYGETSEAAKLKYDLEYGSLKNINDELKKRLLLEAEKLDDRKSEENKDTSAVDAFFEESDELNNAWSLRLAEQATMESAAAEQEKHAYGERQVALSQSFQAAYTQAKGNQELMDALESEYFTNREVLRAQHELNLTDIERAAADERAAYQEQVALNTLSFTQQQLSITTDFLRQSGEEQSAVYRTLFAIQKLAAIPSMIIATEEAATKALTLGPIAGPIASAAVKTMGYASVGIVAGQAFAGQAHDGINRVPRENEGTWLLKANEMVLNPTQADSFRWMVDMMQQMQTVQAAAVTASAGSLAAGGMPVSINVTGVDRSQVQATAQMKDGELQVDMIINQAADKAMALMYEDADNNGQVSSRIRKG